jgi:hypothetical protein
MQKVRTSKCKKTGADAVAEVTPRRPAKRQPERQGFLKPDA